MDVLLYGGGNLGSRLRFPAAKRDSCGTAAPPHRGEAATMHCLEIEDVETRSFWGIPYVSVSGHARHIQKGVVFCASEVAPLDGIPSRDVDRVIHQRIPGWGQQA
jgi:hypothetical protein